MSRFFRPKKSDDIINQYAPDSYGITEIQRLFRLLESKSSPSNEPKNFMVTSAMPEEGKSTLIGHLGLVAARAGLRTLIIDVDLRRPAQHRMFPSMSPSPGLSDFLRNEVKLNEIIHDTELELLRIIPCGSRVSTPIDLLQHHTADFKELLELCRARFDVVLLDTPPILPVPDAEFIGSLVDNVLLIVRAGKTFREVIKRAHELLQRSGCNLLGVVLNNVENTLPYYYEGKYYNNSHRSRWSTRPSMSDVLWQNLRKAIPQSLFLMDRVWKSVKSDS